MDKDAWKQIFQGSGLSSVWITHSLSKAAYVSGYTWAKRFYLSFGLGLLIFAKTKQMIQYYSLTKEADGGGGDESEIILNVADATGSKCNAFFSRSPWLLLQKP